MNNPIEKLETRQYLSFGDFLSDWGSNGRVFFSDGTQLNGVRDVSVFGDRIYAGTNHTLRAFASNGSPDSSFGGIGRVQFSWDILEQVVVSDAGYIYVLGQKANTDQKILQRYNSRGVLDRKFGTKGSVVISLADTKIAPTALSVSASSICLAGPSTTTTTNAGVIRYNLSGIRDLTYGNKGRAEVAIGQVSRKYPLLNSWISSIRELNDKSVIFAGGSVGYYLGDVIGSAQIFSAKFTAAGIADGKYGTSGVAHSNLVLGDEIQRAFTSNVFDQNNADVTQGSFCAAIDASGTAFIAGKGGKLGVAAFDSKGKTIFATNAPGDYMLQNPTDALIIKGRFVLVGEPSKAFSGHGAVMATVNALGHFNQPVSTDDLSSATKDISGGNSAVLNDRISAAVSSDGKLILGGTSSDETNAELMKFGVGRTTDQDANFFANGTTSSMARDSKGILHFAYYDSASQTLKYSYQFPNGRWGAVTSITTSQQTGIFASLDVDSKDHPWIAYYDGQTADLRIATTSNLGKTWHDELVDSSGVTGWFASLKIERGQTDKIDIAYFRKTSADLRFAQSSGNGSWSLKTIDAVGDVGRSCVMAVGNDLSRLGTAYANTREPFIAYWDATQQRIKVTRRSAGGSWQTSSITSVPGGAAAISAAFGPSAIAPEAAISYYIASTADLGEAYLTNGSWSASTDLSHSAQGSRSQVVFPVGLNSQTPSLSPSIYNYASRADLVVMLVDGTRSLIPVLEGGGREFSIASSLIDKNDLDTGYVDIAYYETATSGLRVISAPRPFIA